MVLHASFRNRSLRRTSYLGDKICRTIFKLFLYFRCQSFLSEYNFKNGSPGIRVLIVKVEKKNSWEILSFPYFEGYISRVLNLLQAWVIIFLSFQLICFSFSSSKGTIGAPKVWNEMKNFARWKKEPFCWLWQINEETSHVVGIMLCAVKDAQCDDRESPWKTMERKRWSGTVTNSNNWFWNFPLWNKYRLWSSKFFHNYSIKAFTFVLDWPKLEWIVQWKRRKRILMTRYSFVNMFML